jgi:hypothetical protein
MFVSSDIMTRVWRDGSAPTRAIVSVKNPKLSAVQDSALKHVSVA